MVRRLSWILGCTALMLGCGISANAQRTMDTDLGQNWDLRMGFFLPENAGARAAQGDVWFTVGAERAVYEVDRWKATFSVDYYGSASLYNVPITLNLRGNTHKLRYGAGAGLGISHNFNEGILGFSYNVLAGYTLMQGQNDVTFDIRYQGLGSAGNVLNGWQFTFGYHF